jgi:hypothetical protein
MSKDEDETWSEPGYSQSSRCNDIDEGRLHNGCIESSKRAVAELLKIETKINVRFINRTLAEKQRPYDCTSLR